MSSHIIEATERTILGAILVDNRALHSADLNRGDFSTEAHRRIFAAMVRLSDQAEPVDLVTLRHALDRDRALELAGGVAYLAGLVEGVPRLENVGPWSAIVRAAAQSRRLAAGLSAAAEANGPEAQIATAQAILDAQDARADGTVPIGSLAKGAFESFEAIATRAGMVGLPTGFRAVDKLLCGLRGGDLIILAARPGVGKSSFGLQVARYSSARSLIVSLEMTKLALVRRLMSAESGVNQRQIPYGLEDSQWKALATAGTTAFSLPIWLNSDAHTVGEVRRAARRIHALGLIVIDYLQLMEAPDRRGNREQEISGISRGLKRLAEDMNVPVLALSQLSRPPRERKDKRPQLTDLRESGAIEQDADVVMLIYREELHAPTEGNAGKADIIVAKQREGDTGTARLNWDKTCTRFYEDPEPEQETLL